MKKVISILLGVVLAAGAVQAQDHKFGHVNMQEIIFLMDEMDAARAEMTKFEADIQETYNSMVQEFQTKYSTYQQMAANWTPSVLQTKQQELQDLEARLQQYQQSVQSDMANLQQQLMMPIQQKANDAVAKVGKANGLTFVFDISAGSAIYWDDTKSMDITEQLKAELNIPLDKQLPQAQQQM